MQNKRPDIPTVKLIQPSYQPSKAEPEQHLRVNAKFEELTAAVVRPVKIR